MASEQRARRIVLPSASSCSKILAEHGSRRTGRGARTHLERNRKVAENGLGLRSESLRPGTGDSVEVRTKENLSNAAVTISLFPYLCIPPSEKNMNMHCRSCGSASIRRSHLRAADFLFLVFLLRPVRCRECNARQFWPLWKIAKLKALRKR